MSGNYKQEQLTEAEMSRRMEVLKKVLGDNGQTTKGLWPLIEKDKVRVIR